VSRSEADTLVDRVILARAQLIIDVRRMVDAKPGEYRFSKRHCVASTSRESQGAAQG